MPTAIDRQGGVMPVKYTQLEAGIARIEVHRPEVRNALDWEAMEQFSTAVEQAWQANDLRVLIVSGYGKSFIAGGDLKALHTHTARSDGQRLSTLMTETLIRLEDLPCPTIAAVNGPARGGGAEIALACDLRVLAEDADLGFVQIRLGLIPGWGAGQRLLRLAGYSRALEWLSTGRVLSAEEAFQHGLANRVVPAGQAVAGALDLARGFAAQAPLAIQAIKQLLLGGLHKPPAEAAEFEQSLFPDLWAGSDHLQAVEAFLRRKTEP
jgi:enoyl-CoA hydratase/carnithine racemase